MEIRANELRIGNYIEKSLKSGQGRSVVYAIGCQDLVRMVEDTGSFNYSPIPLTEEILLKCGFKIYKDSMYCGGIGPLGLVKDDGKYFLCAQDDTGYILDGAVQIESLHHLQNVYSDLEREELNVQL